MMQDRCGALRAAKPYLLMVFLQFGFAGMFIVSVASLKQGMNHYVLVVYRNAVAAAFMVPLALWFDRKTRPPMTRTCFLKITALALTEIVLDQNLYYAGVKLTSASFGAALTNMLPAVTFVMAFILRIERVNIKRVHSQAKVFGALVTVAGALVMILYVGPVVGFPWTEGRAQAPAAAASHGAAGSWLEGTFFLIGSCTCWSAFFILQSNTLESYPAELSLTAWICSTGTLLSAAVTVVLAPGTRPWAIGFDMNLLAAVYSGIMCSGVAYYVQGVVMKEKGPVFVTAFSPLCMIVVAVLGSLVLAEDITLGRVIGAAVIVVGLYLLIWGKTADCSPRAKDVELDLAAIKMKPATASERSATSTPSHVCIV